MFERLKNHLRARLRPKPIELDSKDGYALWAPAYPAHPHNPLMELEQGAMLELMPDVAGKAALDLACGSGRYLNVLTKRGASQAVGLDISPQMLDRAQNNRGRLVQGDLCRLPLASASFDVVVCGLAVGHVEDLRSVISEIARVLIPGGIAVYSDFHPFGALAGWKRTFRGQDGQLYALRHYFHLYSDHHAACRNAGLAIEDVREPEIDFEHEWRGCPAVLVLRVRKDRDL